MLEFASEIHISKSLTSQHLVMPKVVKANSLSADRSKSSPNYCRSKDSTKKKSKEVTEKEKNVEEWEQTRCPICMEHPHSAVLLQCSSLEKGCRPYICNTGNQHSNCLGQYQKSFAGSSRHTTPKITCPLCRGHVNGWIVVEPARHVMNSQSRGCPARECEFVGSYLQLRSHVRQEHPNLKPSEVDSAQHQEWLRLERERELKDVFCYMFPNMGEVSPADYESRLNWFILSMHQRHQENSQR